MNEHNFRVITHKQAWVIFALGVCLGMIILSAVWATWPTKRNYIPSAPPKTDSRFIWV